MSCKAQEGPNLTGEGICDGGAPVLCGGSQCCNSAAEARNVCGVQFGPTYGWSNTWAQAIPKGSKNYVDCGRSGAAYECRATIAPSCPNRYNRPYNKDGPFGSHRVGVQPTKSSEWNRRDEFCREKNGPNAVMTTTPRPDIAPGAVKEECDIFEWKTQPLEQCCTPGSQTMPGLYESLCSPQTCFGKPACDNALVTQTICSDRDNVTKDQACVDACITNNTDVKKQQACVDACKLAAATRDQLCLNTCVRLNESGGVRWCNDNIKAYCQGKNLETETCRQYCSAPNIDNNQELVNFCDATYLNYCKSTDYKTYDKKKQDELCGCINSRFPQANCVDAKCANTGTSILTSLQRKTIAGGCSDVCTQNIFIDAEGNATVDINNNTWTQICGKDCPAPGQPGYDPKKCEKTQPPGPGPTPQQKACRI